MAPDLCVTLVGCLGCFEMHGIHFRGPGRQERGWLQGCSTEPDGAWIRPGRRQTEQGGSDMCRPEIRRERYRLVLVEGSAPVLCYSAAIETEDMNHPGGTGSWVLETKTGCHSVVAAVFDFSQRRQAHAGIERHQSNPWMRGPWLAANCNWDEKNTEKGGFGNLELLSLPMPSSSTANSELQEPREKIRRTDLERPDSVDSSRQTRL